MKYLILLITFLTLAGCMNMPTQAPSHKAMAQQLSSKVVALVGKARDGEIRAYCSGVWIGRETILTANHCVADDLLVGFVVRSDVFSSGVPVPKDVIDVHPAVVSLRDEEHDLAILQTLAAPKHEIAVVSSYDVQQGSQVQAMGQPLGLWWSYSSGEVAAIRWNEGAMDSPMLFIQSTCPISPGSSGGGLFDEWGSLVGITHASHQRGQGVNLFVHTSYIRSVMFKARELQLL